MIALIAVIDAQKMNGTVIRNPMIWAGAIRHQIIKATNVKVD
jgi:hypothetical protein